MGTCDQAGQAEEERVEEGEGAHLSSHQLEGEAGEEDGGDRMVAWKALVGVIFDLGPLDHTGEAEGLSVYHGGAIAIEMDRFGECRAVHDVNNEADKEDRKDQFGDFPNL